MANELAASPLLEIWNQLEVTDKAYTKPVSRPGGFKGTAVDPVYNIKRVTAVLGAVGFAWGWHVLGERLDTFGEGQDAVTLHSMTVRAWFRQDDGSVREVDHVGHTKVAEWSRAFDNKPRRFVVDEEFGKKSLTDALSKIMMSLGASADIWLGRFDGNKYVAPADDKPEPKTNGHAKGSSLEDDARILLADVRGMEPPGLRGARDWLKSRWKQVDRDLRDALAGAMARRAEELGIDLKESA